MWPASIGSVTTYSHALPSEQQRDLIAHLGPPEIWQTSGRFRFVPSSYLTVCDLDSDTGAAHLLYLRSLISDESEE
jgi:hypothetical protein